MLRRAALLALLPALGLAGCDDTMFGGSTVVPANYTPDADGVNNLITDHCLSCHGEGAGTQPVLPDDIVADMRAGGTNYVTPFSREDSLLWRVLSDTQLQGEIGPMPFGAPLDPAMYEHVGVWIDEGALLPGDQPDTDTP